MASAKGCFQFAQHRSAGKAEVQVKAGYLASPQVSGVAGAQFGHRDRSIDVIESFDRGPGVKHFVARPCAVRKKRSDHGHVRSSKFSAKRGHNILPSFINVDAAKRSEERRVGKECRSRW